MKLHGEVSDMMTVHEVSRLTGVSIRALHHYDRIGLLRPAAVTDAGYRLYDDRALERLQQILLFRELEFPLREIASILDSPGFDRGKALEEQITLLEMRREQTERLIALARDMQKNGGSSLRFDAFDKSRMEEYAAGAKARWGNTAAWKEYEEKSRDRGPGEEQDAARLLMEVLAGFRPLADLPADAPEARAQVERLQTVITENWYTCTPEILAGLGQMYAAGGDMTENIDRCCGEGTAAAAARAIAAYTA